jgi:hypothetical protein
VVILELIHAEKAPHGVVFIRLKTVGCQSPLGES